MLMTILKFLWLPVILGAFLFAAVSIPHFMEFSAVVSFITLFGLMGYAIAE